MPLRHLRANGRCGRRARGIQYSGCMRNRDMHDRAPSRSVVLCDVCWSERFAKKPVQPAPALPVAAHREDERRSRVSVKTGVT